MKALAGWIILLLFIPLHASEPPANFDGSLVFDLEHGPVRYSVAASGNPIARLQSAINKGERRLTFDRSYGFLPSILEALQVPPSSQALVFSKTSFQAPLILPSSPRAIFFNDEVYIGWVKGADYLEISTADPDLGGVFYVLEQEPARKPQIQRHDDCLQCHQSARTAGVPGHMVRSVYAMSSGLIHTNTSSFVSDHRSPFDERYGGWYVTGTHGKATHMGNQTTSSPMAFNPKLGANLTSLIQKFDVNLWPQPTSDIVALLVLEHQTMGQNYLARLNYETRAALDMQRALHQMDNVSAPPSDPKLWSESTRRRVGHAIEATVRYLTFADEAPLPDPIQGSNSFAADFAKRAPIAADGRSLRTFNLKNRLFQYPLSYLVYSRAIDSLEPVIRQRFFARLSEVLLREAGRPGWEHLDPALSRTAWEILSATRDLPKTDLTQNQALRNLPGVPACFSSR